MVIDHYDGRFGSRIPTKGTTTLFFRNHIYIALVLCCQLSFCPYVGTDYSDKHAYHTEYLTNCHDSGFSASLVCSEVVEESITLCIMLVSNPPTSVPLPWLLPWLISASSVSHCILHCSLLVTAASAREAEAISPPIPAAYYAAAYLLTVRTRCYVSFEWCLGAWRIFSRRIPSHRPRNMCPCHLKGP